MVALPVKLAVGVNITLVPPTMLAAPLVGDTLVIANASPSGSLSLTRGSNVMLVFFAIDSASATATGGRLVTLTVINAVAVALPSLIVWPIVALPEKLAVGVNITLVPPTMLAAPLVGDTLVIASASPSGSLSFALGLKVILVFLAMESTSATATGGRLVTLTVIRAVAAVVPSLIV